MTDKCKVESTTKKFCSIRADSNCDGCPEKGGNYRKVCEPKGWATFAYKQLYKGKPIDKGYEAHHILCVSPVTKVLAGNPDIKPAIEETEWCINNETNMVAMPLWGHTVLHYLRATQAAGGDLDKLVPPPFENLPQHNIDHNSSEGYTQEIHDECARVAYAIEESGHDLKGDSLKKALDELSKKWRGEIKTRGHDRQGGTHKAWKKGTQDPSGSDWIHPFSMASNDKISKVGFPVRTFDDKKAAWMDRLAKAMGTGG